MGNPQDKPPIVIEVQCGCVIAVYSDFSDKYILIERDIDGVDEDDLRKISGSDALIAEAGVRPMSECPRGVIS